MKQQTFLRDVIIPTLSDLFPTEAIRSYALANPFIYNIEHLIELCLAKLGGYSFVDEAGYDFTDFSDSKTTTVNKDTRIFEIGSVENKIGSLRICAFNSISDSIDYFYLTQEELRIYETRCAGYNSHKTRLRGRWNEKYDHYNMFERFRVKSFEELAKKGTNENS